MRRKLAFILFSVVLSSSSVAFGFMIGSTNLVTGYPNFYERSPSPPYGASSYMREQYHNDVVDYVNRAKEYVDASNNDIKTIQDSRNEVIDSINRTIDEHNVFFNR